MNLLKALPVNSLTLGRYLQLGILLALASLQLVWADNTELKANKILFLGDSLTDGYGIDQQDAYPYLVEKYFQEKGYSVSVINAGISGSTSASVHGRLLWLLREKPNIMLLAIGANDGLRGLSLSNMRANIEKTVELAIDNNISVVIAGIRIPPNYGIDYSENFFETYESIAKKYNLVLIPFLMDKVAGEVELNLDDGIHPNEEGHKVIASNVLPFLEPLLVDK